MRPFWTGVLCAFSTTASAADLAEIKKRGEIRFLVTERSDHLSRGGDPREQELLLAEAFAKKLRLKPKFISVAQHEMLLNELEAGRGDVVVASLAVTPERAKRVGFTRAIRHVEQLVVVARDAPPVTGVEALVGKTLSVRASSSYAASLKALAQKHPGIQVHEANEREDTFDLIHKVATGEIWGTVADSDIFAAASAYETNVRSAFQLTRNDVVAWALDKSATALKAALDAFLVESAMTAFKDRSYLADLDEIRKRGVLRVLTRNAMTCYFLYRGEQMGFEYELAREFAASLGVRLEIIVAPDRDSLLDELIAGKSDLVAAGLTRTAAREARVAFTRPYLSVSELVVVPRRDSRTQTLEDLRGRTIHVQESSSFHEHLMTLREKYGFQIASLPAELEMEDILEQVGSQKIEATVADSHVVELEQTFSDDIRAIGPITDIVHLGWALRKDQPKLLAAADVFFKKTYRGLRYNMMVNKYFKHHKVEMRPTEADARGGKPGKLSPFDALTKKFAKQYELDWRLVTSQMYQESRFDPKAKSWVGAQGLMQVMPRTAEDLKFDDVIKPENGIHAGIKLLARYSKLFESTDVAEKDRLRFALAAYNSGPGHVEDARRLAKALAHDPNKWFGNVEKAMLRLSEPEHAKRARYGYCRGSEPVKYVSEIQARYDAYSTLVGLE